MRQIRPAPFCRSWLFLEGASEQVLRSAASSGADVLIQGAGGLYAAALAPLGAHTGG
jgi:citrate lyase subunit beta / citryl-CoA lyase